MQNNLVEIFFQAAKQYPENIAIVYKGKQVTYRELNEQVQSSMDYFSKKGIRKGDRILVFVPMSIALYKTVLALFGLGATVVFVDEWSDKSRLRKALQVVDVHAIVAPKKYIWLAYLISPFRNISKKISVPSN